MKSKGFTLVELLVVIAIISILTVITVSQFETARKKARDAQRKGDVNAVTKALQMYFADYNALPPDDGMSGLNINTLFLSGGEFKDGADYIYMKVMPKEMRVGWSPYCYELDITGKKYAVYAMLENTADSDCHLAVDKTPLYKSKCGTNAYCFALTSPNARLNPNTGILE